MTDGSTGTHRTIVFTLRLTPEEHRALLAAAASAATPPSTFARSLVLGRPQRHHTYVRIAPEDIGQIKRLGNLLNQIARAGWRDRFTQPTNELLDSVLTDLKTTLRTLSLARPAP